jgi:putative phosphoesterase
MPEREIIVGVISDTHGLMRPAAIEALRGSDLIIHAGDVGTPEVLDALRAVAPTFAVRGNVDAAPWVARPAAPPRPSPQCYSPVARPQGWTT